MANRQYAKLDDAPPLSQEIHRIFSAPAITVQQTTRGWLQECFGCEAQSEYRVFHGHLEQGQPRAEGIPQIGHLLEEHLAARQPAAGPVRVCTLPPWLTQHYAHATGKAPTVTSKLDRLRQFRRSSNRTAA